MRRKVNKKRNRSAARDAGQNSYRFQMMIKKALLNRGAFSFQWKSPLKIWLRGVDSNHRPPGYEPDELPLLYPASHIFIQAMNLPEAQEIYFFS